MKVLALILALVMILAITACNNNNSNSTTSSQPPASDSSAPAASPSASTASQDKITVRLGTAGARGHNMTEWMYQFTDALYAKTDKFVVEQYPSNQYGSNNEMVEALLSNKLQGCGVPAAFYGSYCRFVNILDVPFLFPDYETCYEFMNSSPEIVVNAFREIGLYPLTWPYSNTFWTDSTVPIHSVADFKGLNVRGNNTSIWQDIWAALGCNGVVIDTADLALALQQGAVDAHIGPFTIIHSMLIGVIDYLVELPDNPSFDCFMFNDEFLQSLSEEDRSLFVTTALEVTEGVNKDYLINATDEFIANFLAEGIEMTYADDQMKADLRAALMPIKESFPEKYPDLADDYNALVEAIEAFTK